jgi:hypothetical protein
VALPHLQTVPLRLNDGGLNLRRLSAFLARPIEVEAADPFCSEPSVNLS